MVCSRPALSLFDPGSTHLYVSSYFAAGFDMTADHMCTPLYVSSPVGRSLVVDRVYRYRSVVLSGYETFVDVIELDMVDFDIILGMDWLAPHHAVLDC